MPGRGATRVMVAAAIGIATVVLSAPGAGAETEKQRLRPACRALQQYFDDARFSKPEAYRRDLRTALRRARAADASEMAAQIDAAIDAFEFAQENPPQTVADPGTAALVRMSGHLALASAECVEAGIYIIR